MEVNKVYLGDCLDLLKEIPDASVDMILCDLPYGTCASSWDKLIPMDLLWKEYERVIKRNRAIVLFSQQPFTTKLINSNIPMWKYNWIWKKEQATNFLSSHYRPMKITEDICVFGSGATSYSKKGTMIYNPQFEKGVPYTITSGKQKDNSAVVRGVTGREECSGFTTVNDGVRYPVNIISIPRDKNSLHPTQKPVKLCEYLISTYSNEGDLVLDNCIGSGTTGVAALNLKRNFIGFEKDKKYFDIATDRIANVSVWL